MTKPSRLRVCPVPACHHKRQSGHVLCSRCWFLVPADLRDHVWKLYRSARGSEAHRRACFAAIRAAHRARTAAS